MDENGKRKELLQNRVTMSRLVWLKEKVTLEEQWEIRLGRYSGAYKDLKWKAKRFGHHPVKEW